MYEKPSSHRLGFIDQLRGWAVIVMIEVHTFNEWIRPDLKATDLWEAITFINGLVAPSFIFLAGFSMGLAAVRKWDAYVRTGPDLWKRLRHLLLIFLVGYGLHLPAPFFRSWRDHPIQENIDQFLAVDVLQLIVVSLLIAHGIILIFRRRDALLWIMTGLGIAAFFFTPWAYRTAFFDSFPVWIADYFSKARGSLFPLFPWGGFAFFGVALGLLYAQRLASGDGDAWMRRSALWGLAVAAIALLWHFIPVTIQPQYDFWRGSPQFAFLRLGIVMMLLAFLWFVEKRFGSNPDAVRVFGQESFFIYAAHLMLLYKKFSEDSLATIWRGQFNYFDSILGYAVILFSMYLTAISWRWIKRRNMRSARIFMTLFFIAAAFLFFFLEDGSINLWIFS